MYRKVAVRQKKDEGSSYCVRSVNNWTPILNDIIYSAHTSKPLKCAQKLGMEDHNLIFEEIHLEDNRLNTEQQMIDFLGKHGIDTNNFMEKYNSFGTEARIKKASNLAKKYQINSVPTIIVNGKYLTSGSYVSSYDELYSVINLLIERERNDL